MKIFKIVADLFVTDKSSISKDINDFENSFNGICDFCGEETEVSQSAHAKTLQGESNKGIGGGRYGSAFALCRDCLYTYSILMSNRKRQKECFYNKYLEEEVMKISNNQKKEYKHTHEIFHIDPEGKKLIHIRELDDLCNVGPGYFFTFVQPKSHCYLNIMKTIDPKYNIFLNILGEGRYRIFKPDKYKTLMSKTSKYHEETRDLFVKVNK